MLKKSNKKFECSSLCIVIFSIIIICILYTVLNFRGHIVIKNKKVIGYKWGIVEKVKRDEKYVLYTIGDIPFFGQADIG